MAAPVSEGYARVAAYLAERGHPHTPRWLDAPARTCAEAAQALGVAVGQIAKSVVFRRVADERAVLIIASGDLRVDQAKVSALAGDLARADAAFVKAQTGFVIGGVAPVGHRHPPVVFIDQELQRFAKVWAAAGHPNGVFMASPKQLSALAGAPFANVAAA